MTFTSERGTVRSGQRDVELPPAASPPDAVITRRRCCPTARCWRQGALVALLPARNCTTRPAGRGVPPVASPPHATHHTATLLPNGKVLVAGDMMASTFLAARNCTTRPVGRGVPPVASASTRMFTRRRCYPMARYWWREEGKPAGSLLTARNCTTRPAGRGVSPATSTPHAMLTRRRCYPTAEC